MGKAYGICNLCGSHKFLNFAGLCKRCNKKAESSKITEKALAKELEYQQMKAVEAKEAEEAAALEEEEAAAAEGEEEPEAEGDTGESEGEQEQKDEKDGS
jgi:hypothetical protein